jgi:hypothetical protein
MPTTDYSKYLVDKPLIKNDKLAAKYTTARPLQLMSSIQVPEAKYNIEFSWVTDISASDPNIVLHTHEYNEVLLFIGEDCRDPENLFAEIELMMGNERLVIDSTGAVFIPSGVPHGQPALKKITKPHVEISLGIGIGIGKSIQATSAISSKNTGYSKYQVKKPAYEVMAGTPVKGRQGPSSMTFMNNNLVPGSDIYVEGGWVWDMPDPNPHIFEHVHDYEEMVIHFGSEYKWPLELGAEIDFCVGGQPLKIAKTSAVYVPSGIKHGPLTWKKYQYPHFEMAIMPGAGTLDEADPGGHREKARRNSNDG